MRKIWNKKKNAKRLMAISLCVGLVGSLIPVTVLALEDETACDVSECLGAACVQEGCLCGCHKIPETTASAPVTVQTEPAELPMETLVPAETQTTEETKETKTIEETQEPTETTVPMETLTPAETVPAETTEIPMETLVPAETVEETTEAPEESGLLTVTWLDQNGEVLASAEVEPGALLAEEDFPALEQVGWYVCGEENSLTETPVKVGTPVEQALTVRAVDRSVALTLSGECTVGSDVTLTVTLTGFAGEEYAIQWQSCPIDETGAPLGEWANVEGASGMEYTYTIAEDAQNLSWRVVLTVQ